MYSISLNVRKIWPILFPMKKLYLAGFFKICTTFENLPSKHLLVQSRWCHSAAFNINFGHVPDLFLVFPFLLCKSKCLLGNSFHKSFKIVKVARCTCRNHRKTLIQCQKKLITSGIILPTFLDFTCIKLVKKEELPQWTFCMGEMPSLKKLFTRTCCWSTINCSWLGRPCSWIIFFSLRNWSHSCSSSFCIRQSSSFFICNRNKFE